MTDNLIEERTSYDLSENCIALFSDCKNHSVTEIGGKALALVKLADKGFPIPRGFCVTSNVYFRFLSVTGIHKEIYRLLECDDVDRFEKITTIIKNTEMPNDIQSKLFDVYSQLSTTSVAVRSSGIDEDSIEYSFAGQHDTFLFIDDFNDIIQYIKECWSSMWNSSAQAYRSMRNISFTDASMGVVVQEMIDSDISGVAFGQHPLTGQRDNFLIESCFGLGEGLVSGRVVSDSYLVDKTSLICGQRKINYKLTKLVFDEQRIIEEKVPENNRNDSSLSDEKLVELSKYLERIEKLYGQPQDVEWTYSNGELSILQSRPITQSKLPSVQESNKSIHLGKPKKELEDNILWSRMDIGEIFTGRLSPLGVSFAKHYQYKVHRECGKGLGLLDLGEPDEYMTYYKGHVYLNVAYTAYLLSQTPVGKDQWPFLERFCSEEVDLQGYKNPYGDLFKSEKHTASQCVRFWLTTNIKEFFGAKKRAKKMVDSRYREYDRAIKQNLPSFNHTQLREEINHALDYFNSMHQGYLPFYINAFGFYGLLEELCGKWLGSQGKHIQNELKGDMSNLRTVQTAKDVWTLCLALDNYSNLKETFKNATPDEILKHLINDVEGIAFYNNEFMSFMRENGVRGSEEMELTNPRWVDDPTYVIQMMKSYLIHGYDVNSKLENMESRKTLSSDQIMKSLSFPKRFLLKKVIKLYCACSRLREETRMSMITSIWLVRRIVYEVARRLQSKGIIKNMVDVQYLDFNDILNYIYEYDSEERLFAKTKVAAVKKQHLTYLKEEEPPLTFIGYASSIKSVQSNDSNTVLGLGTSSGQYSGNARVIVNLAMQADEVEKGDIIITQYTDASWTPLFSIAGAIVTDVGSMLSHSSIVAREFGIPSVVNTKNATSLIKTGDNIVVDGTHGTIKILSKGK